MAVGGRGLTLSQDARKNFVLGYLREQNINPKEFKTLEKALRIKHQGALEKAFATLFLDFCRRGNWEDAAGKDDSWIEIKGMAAWHVRKTIIALSGMKGNSGSEFMLLLFLVVTDTD